MNHIAVTTLNSPLCFRFFPTRWKLLPLHVFTFRSLIPPAWPAPLLPPLSSVSSLSCTHACMCLFLKEIHGSVCGEVREGPGWSIPCLVSHGSRGLMGCLHESRLYYCIFFSDEISFGPLGPEMSGYGQGPLKTPKNGWMEMMFHML